MTTDIKISIIIPTYKPQAYLWECLNSIYGQTIAPKDIELILVLNGCKEPYLAQIKEYLSKKDWPNVKLLQTDEPGVSNARNIGLKAAHGEYICFIDDDDWISDNYLKDLTEIADRGADIVASNVVCYSDSTQELSEDYIGKAFLKMKNSTHIPIVQARKFMSSSCCKIIRRDKMANTLFDSNITIGEDSLFMASISCRIQNICTSAPDVIYYRRLRHGSASRNTLRTTTRIRNATHLAIAYTKVLSSAPLRYNWFFFASRYIALLIYLVG